MTKSIADLYNEVQNIANTNRRLDVNNQWADAATPGHIPFDETNNDYMKNVNEAQSKIQQNKANYASQNWASPGPAPIPTMREPKMTTTPTDKKPTSMREALEQVQRNSVEQINESEFGREFKKHKEGETFMFHGKPIKRITAKPSTGNVVAKDKPMSTISPGNKPADPKSFFKPGVDPNKPRNSGDSVNMSKPEAERTKPAANVPLPPPSSARPAPAPATDPGARENQKRATGTLNNSYENPMIAAFLRLQEMQGNVFESAKKIKKKHKEPDDKGNQTSVGGDDEDPGAVPESVQENMNLLPGHRRLSMFDPTQGYARTAGSADGAKEKLEALWGAVTGQPTVQRDPSIADAIRADLQAMKEEYGNKYQNEMNAIYEALELIEAKKDSTSDLAKLAAAAIAKGHPVKKLPAGKAQGWADNNVKSSFGGGVSKINSSRGTQSKARFREEVEFSDEELAHIQSVLEGNPINSASVEGPSSSAQAARGSQVDKATLTDSKKKF